jgi:hypothetical protein
MLIGAPGPNATSGDRVGLGRRVGVEHAAIVQQIQAVKSGRSENGQVEQVADDYEPGCWCGLGRDPGTLPRRSRL